MKSFKGIFPALLTPFDKNDELNERALTELIAMNVRKGVSGFYVGGSTAEAFLLSDSERKRVYEAVKESAPSGKTLIAHVGAISTKQAISYAKHAESLGYDAVSAIAPFYYKFTKSEIIKYYQDISASTSLPMIIYNFPSFSGVELSLDELSELLSDEKIIGVKHTSSDYFKMQGIKARHPDKYVYNGYDEMFLAGLSMGADGAIGSTFNFMAEKFVSIYDLWQKGSYDEAHKIQTEANAVIRALIDVGVMSGEKAVLNLMGLDLGDARPPFSELTADEIDMLRKKVLPYCVK